MVKPGEQASDFESLDRERCPSPTSLEMFYTSSWIEAEKQFVELMAFSRVLPYGAKRWLSAETIILNRNLSEVHCCSAGIRG
jgi:hypothetical protein